MTPSSKDFVLGQYDSVVDDMYNPEEFVVFNESAAYPEYIIKFTGYLFDF